MEKYVCAVSVHTSRIISSSDRQVHVYIYIHTYNLSKGFSQTSTVWVHPKFFSPPKKQKTTSLAALKASLGSASDTRFPTTSPPPSKLCSSGDAVYRFIAVELQSNLSFSSCSHFCCNYNPLQMCWMKTSFLAPKAARSHSPSAHQPRCQVQP